MKGDLKRVGRLFSNTIAYFRMGVRDLWLRHKLLSKWRKYIPKYWTRTAEENEIIRERIKVSSEHCDHLKGRLHRGGYKDYNVSQHRFIDGSYRIICNTCKQRWLPTDADWDKAALMVKQSTNQPSASEQPIIHNGEV